MSRNNIFSCLLWILVAATAAMGQSSGITGIVTDPTGAVVVGAKVTVKNQNTDLERTAVTSDQGYYVVPFLPADNYGITVEAPNFKLLEA